MIRPIRVELLSKTVGVDLCVYPFGQFDGYGLFKSRHRSAHTEHICLIVNVHQLNWRRSLNINRQDSLILGTLVHFSFRHSVSSLTITSRTEPDQKTGTSYTASILFLGHTSMHTLHPVHKPVSTLTRSFSVSSTSAGHSK